jgi:hypothetical protein
MKKYILRIPDAISDRIEKAHKRGKFSALLLSQFIKHLVTMGLEEYQAQEKYRNEQMETHLKAAGCETVPALPSTTAKIIPFPGVLKEADGGIQDTLEGFLHEIGYIE